VAHIQEIWEVLKKYLPYFTNITNLILMMSRHLRMLTAHFEYNNYEEDILSSDFESSLAAEGPSIFYYSCEFGADISHCIFGHSDCPY